MWLQISPTASGQKNEAPEIAARFKLEVTGIVQAASSLDSPLSKMGAGKGERLEGCLCPANCGDLLSYSCRAANLVCLEIEHRQRRC